MTHPDREDIHLIGSYSDLTAGDTNKALHTFVYSDKNAWQKFLKIFFLTLGTGFFVAGVIFFFAYNWNNLHKFIKIGIAEGLVILPILAAVLFSKMNPMLRKTLITASAVFVGVLFAVFGQVYQTGADSFDLFFNWTLCVTIWAIAAGFAPLWLIWIVLVNVSWGLYNTQYGTESSMLSFMLGTFIFNSLCLIVTLSLKKSTEHRIPTWFAVTLALIVAYFVTTALAYKYYDRSGNQIVIYFVLAALLYSWMVWYSIRNKTIVYPAIAGASTIIIITSRIISDSWSAVALLLACLFVAGSITGLVIVLMKLQKTWANEKNS
ncbi:DUF2157 domain-containing protein [Pseudoflavitalea sp. G-6-1-2]|uniref:DUF2157 domain-containing protein n=1 Tax=Pseudoflavitalea sp. G-6-1-2 TaxID=2728841 RepID=UPI00146EAAF6|nr:DUF2157 domain-containing protein [Pseudoflavitalea sp. G-6-1-2]NML24088.1 DUF2157 domain-containing protein [Pseudoflavitalea sp. G-6-1-2]